MEVGMAAAAVAVAQLMGERFTVPLQVGAILGSLGMLWDDVLCSVKWELQLTRGKVDFFGGFGGFGGVKMLEDER